MAARGCEPLWSACCAVCNGLAEKPEIDVICKQMQQNGRGALAENPEVARAVGERDREGTERPHCLPAILSWNQF